MKTIYVKDITKNMLIENEPFAVLEVNQSKDRNGNLFYNVVLGDKTGRIPGKLWYQQFEMANPKLLKIETIVLVTAKVDEYKGTLQLNILSLQPVNETSLEEFIQSSEYDPDKMLEELFQRVKTIKNKDIREVVTNILSDKEIGRKFKYWPAGNSVHHAFRSGLLQHVLEMLNISDSLRQFYPTLNYDVLIAGIILHDIGKIEELSGGLSSQYTLKGSLIGHINLGVRLFHKFAEKLNEKTKLHIEHLILSHHGKLEYGSPILPSTPEAIALHYIDNLSSKLRSSIKAVSEIPEDETVGRPNYFLEGARFWKKHNEQIDNETDILKNDLSSEQMSLVD
jgi:3'-5' exoribonuclease